MIKFDDLYDLYVNQKSEIKDIAEMHSVCKKTVSKWLLNYNIPNRYNIVDVDAVILTAEQKSIIIGSMLGDGCVFKWSNGYKHALSLTHGDAQKAYLIWKAVKLYPMFVGRKIFEDKRTLPVEWLWQSKRHKYFTEIRETFYPMGTKVVPLNISEMLDPIALAIWYMDDGHTRTGPRAGGRLATHGFTDEENQILSEALYSKFNVKADIYKDRRDDKIYYYLSMKASELYSLMNIISVHIYPIECMQYKIPYSLLRDYMPRHLELLSV